ncbi:SRPBCC domain-containing protein, partial [Escherichia coli]|uniref:SRPBCC domain-containing protein n=1 Tax=Escherichia coli TaxID=562 RepID=UPI001952BCE2
SWFVPSEVEERAGGAAVSHFGPGNSMDAVGTITEWTPPRRFVVEAAGGPGLVASEWTVQARGGSCVVRVVHSWFASSDEWDGQFESHS